MEMTESETERLREQKSSDIYYHEYSMDSMEFFYNMCLNSLTNVMERPWHCEWMKNQFSEFKKKCGELREQLKIAKLTEDGLNEWKENLFGAHATFKDYTYMAKNPGKPLEEKLYERVTKELEICRNVIKEMLRILNPDEKKYKVWYAWPDRQKFLRDIRFLDDQDRVDIWDYNYGLDSMVFFHDKCREYLRHVEGMQLYSEWKKDDFYAFQQKCGEMILQLDIAKQTENGLNEWRKTLLDVQNTLQLACEPYVPNAARGEEGDYRVLRNINQTLETCGKVIHEMLRILNPDEKKYKVWYAPQFRAKFLREIGFLDQNNERQHATRALLKRLASFGVHVKKEPSKYEKGVEIIRTIFRECEELSQYKIDERLVMHPEKYETKNGFSHLLAEMGLVLQWNSEDRELKANMFGPLTMYMNQPQKACEKFSETLRSNDVKIFTWVEILESVMETYEMPSLFAIMDNIQNFMRLFDIEIPTNTDKDTLVVDLHQNMSNSIQRAERDAERSELWSNSKKMLGDILQITFDIDKTFEKKCYLDEKYWCTVAHNEDDKFEGYQNPEKKYYKLVVTWPDGRKEDWTLSFYADKGQIHEFPAGKKHFFEFIFTGKITKKNGELIYDTFRGV